MIDKYIIKFCIMLDRCTAWIDNLFFAPRCKCKKKKNSKRTYKYQKEHATDISFENERKHD